ncbi:MAG: phosphatidate cytidylyltransferase [Oceanococcaceae bacterium]
MLLTRILTALALIPFVVAAVLWLPALALFGLILLVVMLSAWEWSQFFSPQRGVRLGFALLVPLTALVWQPPMLWLSVLGLGFWLLMLIWLIVYPAGLRPGVGQPLLRGVVGLLLFWLFAQSAYALAQMPQGRWLLLVTLVLVWAVDVGGYFFGKRFGRHKLSPQVSPNKSWEGFAGGVLLALLVGLLSAFVLTPPLQGPVFLACALLVAMGSVVGDLCESMFKRQSGIKDSGSLLPGHGGLLDRLDSTFAALPLMLAVGLWLAPLG